MAQDMFSQDEIAVIRRAYARQMLALAAIGSDSRLEEAFAATPRESFLGAPPWQMVRPSTSEGLMPTEDPAVIYQDLSQPEPEREVLKASFGRGGVEFVRSLVWRKTVSPQRCWFTGSGWALSYDEPGS